MNIEMLANCAIIFGIIALFSSGVAILVNTISRKNGAVEDVYKKTDFELAMEYRARLKRKLKSKKSKLRKAKRGF